MEKGISDYYFWNVSPMKMRVLPVISDRYMIKFKETVYETSIKSWIGIRNFE